METKEVEIVTPDESFCGKVADFRNKIHLTTGYLGTTSEQSEKNTLKASESKGGYYIVAMLNDKIVGYSYGYKADEDRGKFDSLYIAKFGVDSSVKGKGVSDIMMQWIYAKAKELGYKYVDLTVDAANTRAVSFYKRNGFVDHGSTYQEMRVGLEGIANGLYLRHLI